MAKKTIKIEPTWLDNVIGLFSPQAKTARLKAKYQTYFLEKVGRKYDGATRGRRGKGWYANSTSVNAETDASLITLRDRSRDLRRNNAYAGRAIQAITANVVGSGIKTQINTSGARRQRLLRELWSQWAGTTACDYEGRMNLAQMQNMIMDAVSESGEVLIRLRRVVPTASNPLPIQLQILESDFIDDTRSSSFNQENGNRILQGIEFDENGKRRFYHLYREHPGSTFMRLDRSSFDSIAVDADTVIHAFRPDRPGQIRGIPWLAAVMLNLRDLDDYEDTQLIRQKIAACFTAFIHDIDSGSGGLTQEEIEDIEMLEPGVIEKLQSGKEITFANPPSVQNYNEYITTMLHKIATGIGVSYEVLTGDLSQVNFSSARMGWIEFHRNITSWQQQIMVGQVLNKVFEWFLDAAELSGFRIDGATAKHIPPRREMIDPTKETQALVKGIRGGLYNLSDVLLQLGQDPEEFFQQKQEDNEALDNGNIVLDSDPRKVTSTGAPVDPDTDSDSTIDE